MRSTYIGLVLVAAVSVLVACPANPASEAGETASESGGESTSETGDGDGDGDGDPGDGDGDGDGDQVPFDYCDGLPPDATCYADKRDPDSESVALAIAIADRYMQMHPPTEQTWDWEAAVLMFSLTELHRVTGEARFQDHYRAYIDHHIDNGYLIETSDTCAPVATAAALYIETGDPKYLGPLEDARVYFGAANRSNDGGLSHFGTFPLQATLWADSLFMFGNVLTRWGEIEDDQALFDEYSLQFEVFASHLQTDSGLYSHSWNWPVGDASLYWGRANGWVTAAGYDYLRALVIREQSDAVAEAVLTEQVAGILASQDPSGLWWIILNHPGEIYLETSTTALFAYGLARGYRYGLLDGEVVLPVIESSVAALETKIVPDGEGLPVVTEISGPTGPGELADYAAIPLEDDISYGVGAVILALIESSGLPPG